MPNLLNIDHDEARALHRVVRAMHDGECPKCHTIHSSEVMHHGCFGFGAWVCPNCKFTITDEEGKEVFRIFGEYMTRNLAIFEKWREGRRA